MPSTGQGRAAPGTTVGVEHSFSGLPNMTYLFSTRLGEAKLPIGEATLKPRHAFFLRVRNGRMAPSQASNAAFGEARLRRHTFFLRFRN